MNTTTINEELTAQRVIRLADVALAMIELQHLGFTTSEGSFLSMTDGTSSVPKDRPYAFYHVQDRDHALQDGSLFIAHGPVDEEFALDRRWLQLGLTTPLTTAMAVADVLRKHVAIRWNGDATKRIEVLLDEEPNR